MARSIEKQFQVWNSLDGHNTLQHQCFSTKKYSSLESKIIEVIDSSRKINYFII